MKKSKNGYFPVRDAQTGRLETVAFCGLGLAGVVLIALAMTDAARFAGSREAILQAWSGSGPDPVEFYGNLPGPLLTNVDHSHDTAAWTHFTSPRRTPASAEKPAFLPCCPFDMDRAMQ